MENFNPSKILKQARNKAGLTQRELAKRAGTAHSVIARIESGKTDPSTGTLNHLLAASGFILEAELVMPPVKDNHMLEDISRILDLSPEDRLEEVKKVNDLATEARRA